MRLYSKYISEDFFLFYFKNFFSGQFVPDLDGDGVPDVLNIHGGDPFGEPGIYACVLINIVILY